MREGRWPSEWLRAVLWACALQVISDHREAYGYQIATALKDRGVGSVGGGTLYPVLKRLEAEHLVVSEWREGTGGPGRKFYRLTPQGERRVAEVAAEWADFVHATSSILRPGGVQR